MSEIHFTIEFSNETVQPFRQGNEWTYFDKIPVNIDYGSNATVFLSDAGNKKICILGHPILNDKINNHEFAKEYLARRREHDFFRRINGEFLLIEVDRDERSIRIINSRFGTPIFWYVVRKGFFLGSTSYYHLCLRLKELDQFQLKPESFYEFLNFRRIFGENTYDKNSLYLKPAHVLTFSKNNIELKPYWHMSYKKSTAKLSDNVEKLINTIQVSIRRKTSDNKRYGLFLSGGMDTRSILANFTENPPHCFTLTYSKNSREFQVANILAKWKNAKYTWVKIQEGHDRKYFNDSVKVTGAMHMTPCLFLGHKALLQKHIDVLFAGFGFDYFFQGMYVPTKLYSLFNGRLSYRRLLNIKGDLAQYFIRNISYRTKGLPVYEILKKNKIQEMDDYLRHVISEIISEGRNISENTFDLWEYINFRNLSRHYTYGGILELMTLAEYRTISYDNDIYDLYLELPAEHKYDAKILRKALKRVNPYFYNFVSANHGFPIKYSYNQRTYLDILRALKNKIIMKKFETKVTPDNFGRTWLPIEVVLRNEMPDFVVSLKDSDELESLGIFDMDRIRNSVDLWMENKVIGDQTFLILLTIARFIKNINQHR